MASSTVCFSGASEPGEGEHKILQAIRRRRQFPGYQPDAGRVMFGQDADLILLALATHEKNMFILRETWGAAEHLVGQVKADDNKKDHDWTLATMLQLELLDIGAL